MEIFPIGFETLLKISTFLFSPDRQFLCCWGGKTGLIFTLHNNTSLKETKNKIKLIRKHNAWQLTGPPLAAFTLNLSLLKASSGSKSHLTNSYNACRNHEVMKPGNNKLRYILPHKLRTFEGTMCTNASHVPEVISQSLLSKPLHCPALKSVPRHG